MRLRNPWLWGLALWAIAAACAFGEVPRAAMCEVFVGRNGGSGVVVGHSETKTYVLSCWHIRSGGQASVKFSNGQVSSAKFERPHGCTDDLLMFVTPRVSVPAAAVAASVTVGEKIHKAGFPAARDGSSPLNVQTGKWLGPGRHTAYCWSGDSGGGVFNDAGELIGIIEGYDRGASNCSSLSATRGFLARWGKVLTQYCQPGYCQPAVPQPILYGGYARPQYPAPSQPGTQPAPKPTTPTEPTPACPECPCDLDALKVQIAAIAASNAKTLVALKQLEERPGIPGPAGPRGDDGRPGKDGSDGKPGRDGTDGKDAPPVDVDAILVELLERIPPVGIRQRNPYTGALGEMQYFRPGDAIILDAVWRRPDQQ